MDEPVTPIEPTSPEPSATEPLATPDTAATVTQVVDADDDGEVSDDPDAAAWADTSTEDDAPAEDTAPSVGAPPRIPSGWRVIAAKEFTDHLLSWRFTILVALLGMIGLFSISSVADEVRTAASSVSGAQGLFLALFAAHPQATASATVPSFIGFIGILGPVLGIVFGFDAVSSERAEGTLPRLVSQPIHRDDVINGKFVASLMTIFLIFVAVMVIIAGVGIIELGIVPSSDDFLRLVTWVIVATLYVGFWLAFAMLCSVVLRRAATAALLTFAVWLIFGLFWGLLGPLIYNAVAPIDPNATEAAQIAAANVQVEINRISPEQLFEELSSVVTDPRQTFLGIVSPEQANSQSDAAVLPLDQSLLIGYPQGVALVAETVACFALAYVVFMRQEVRA